MIRTATANQNYTIITVDEEGTYIPDEGIDNFSYPISIDQHRGDILEVWKEREDGFLFVFSEQMGIGYWVNPILIDQI